MQIERGIVRVSPISIKGEFIRKYRLHLNEMERVFALGDDIQLAGLPSNIAISDSEAVPPEVFSSDMLPKSPYLLASLRGYVHGF